MDPALGPMYVESGLIIEQSIMWDEGTLEMVVIAFLVVIRLPIYLEYDGNDGDGFSGWMLASAQPLFSTELSYKVCECWWM